MTKDLAKNPADTPSCREQLRIAEEEGRYLPQRGRRKPAEAQDATLGEDDACAPERADGHPVPEKTDEPQAPDPAARGRDAPVDVS